MRRVLTAMVAIGLAASTFTKAQAADDHGAATVASTVAGTIFGMPISIVRHQYKDMTGFTKEFVGKDPNPLMYAVALPLCIPTGFINGMMAGIGYCPLNAWKYSKKEPFSADAFSLGKEID
jgi:hypothetical protein